MNKAKKKKSTGNITFKRFIIILWSIPLVAAIAILGLIGMILAGFFGELPSTRTLENPDNPVASELFTADGVLLGRYYSQNRVNVEFEELSPYLVDALIATEDVRFFDHSGIDLRATAAIPYYLAQGQRRGSSTITQQLAKNLFPRQRFSNVFYMLVTKLKEWIIAIQLERNYTKKEIITMYLNTVDFGQNSFGIQSASRTFFGKSPSELDVHEAAVLVGLQKGTFRYSPVHNPDRSIMRRNTVLMQMNRYGFLSDEDYETYLEKDLGLRLETTSHIRGMATHFREYLRGYLRRWADNNDYNIYTDGLKVYTTIDSRMQRYAENAVSDHLKDLQDDFFSHWHGREPWGIHDHIIDVSKRRSDRYRKLVARGISADSISIIFNTPVPMKAYSHHGDIDTVMTPMDSIKYHKYFLRSGMMAMDPSSGKIRAWVSGPDFRYFKYDHVNPNARRQVGSTYKPFVYAMAIMNGYSPCFRVPNVREVYEEYDNWSPTNVDGEYGGMKTLKEGLSQSVNTISAHMAYRVGIENIISLSRKAGINSPIEPYLATALGTPDISVYEMTGAFNVFTNNGVYVEPVFIERIEDRHGNVIEEFVPRTVEVMDPVHNYIMLDMLRDVIDHGTGQRLRFRYGLESDIAGKTGTTQRNSDGWFIGMVPELTAGVWTGGEHRVIRFRSTHLGQGANTALPIWGKFMRQVYDDPELGFDPDNSFVKPVDELPVETDCSRYKDTEEDTYSPF
jgi:penicillin-binding protein 1A